MHFPQPRTAFTVLVGNMNFSSQERSLLNTCELSLTITMKIMQIGLSMCNETGILEQFCTSCKEPLRLRIVYIDMQDGYITNSEQSSIHNIRYKRDLRVVTDEVSVR